VVVTFELERFEWAAPDRLQVAGTFAGLGEADVKPPTLVLRGPEHTHRLAVADDRSKPPQDGKRWAATFAWTEAPEAFDAAELELAPDVVVELPEPHPGERSEVREARVASEMTVNGAGGGAAERLHLQSELLAAQEEAREARDARARLEAELERARQDVSAERDGRAADAERFRDGLATVRASADEALADLRAEHEGAVAELRADLRAAVAGRADAEAAAEALREGLAALKDSEARVQELSAELELARTQADTARTRRTGAHKEIGAAREELERLLERLRGVHDALGDGG
jgi:chromosome segregation ATPase